MVESAGNRRRRRVIVLLATSGLSEPEKQLQVLSEELSAALRVATSTTEVQQALTESETICLTVLDAAFPDVLHVARSVQRVSPNGELIFLTAPDEETSLLKQFGPAPRLGTHWQVVAASSPSLIRLFRTAFLRADQRRATRTTLDRFNARLTAPAQNVDNRELRQLVISDRFLSTILESAFDAVILVDRAGNIAAFNPSAEKLFQRTRDQVLSSPIRSFAAGTWAKDIEASMIAPNADQLLQSSITVEDTVRHLEVSATPVLSGTGDLLATSLILRDVTQRMLSDEALRTNEKLAAVGRLASSIAHEINNPLEAITNLLYLARGSSLSPEVQNYLDMADQELRRMSNITTQTLRFHKQATAPKAVTCEDLIHGALLIFQGRMLSSGIEVQKRKRAHKPVTCMDGEIRQVLNNLVGNAVDAMTSSGGRLLLRSRDATSWTTGAKGLVITVADTGSGMSPSSVKKVFEPFFTTKGIGGTGLGLWISREIVDRHHGTLRVRSSQKEPCSGTVFQLFLPSALDANQALQPV